MGTTQNHNPKKPTEQSMTAADAARTFGLGFLYGVNESLKVGIGLGFGGRIEAYLKQAAVEAGVKQPTIMELVGRATPAAAPVGMFDTTAPKTPSLVPIPWPKR